MLRDGLAGSFEMQWSCGGRFSHICHFIVLVTVGSGGDCVGAGTGWWFWDAGIMGLALLIEEELTEDPTNVPPLSHTEFCSSSDLGEDKTQRSMLAYSCLLLWP